MGIEQGFNPGYYLCALVFRVSNPSTCLFNPLPYLLSGHQVTSEVRCSPPLPPAPDTEPMMFGFWTSQLESAQGQGDAGKSHVGFAQELGRSDSTVGKGGTGSSKIMDPQEGYGEGGLSLLKKGLIQGLSSGHPGLIHG